MHLESFAIATDLDVLPKSRVVERRDGYLLVRSPSNPAHYWGNFLVFEEPPRAGDGGRWEELFDHEFGDEPRVRHRAFTWDRTDGATGRAREEFVARRYELDDSIGLIAAELRPHPRASADVSVRALDPAGDPELWAAVTDLQVASRDTKYEQEAYREFVSARLSDRRELFRAGRGAWYVALAGDGAVAGSCGIVVTAGRGRFQVVETAPAYRRRGVASRLLVEASRHARDVHGAACFVIVAEAGYHALGLYESLGFERSERVFGVCQLPESRA